MIRRMMGSDTPQPVTERAAVLDVFYEHRAIHAYGIVDVVQFWDASHWWVRDRGVVGLVGLPGVSEGVVYAVSAVYAAATLALLTDVVDVLPGRFAITGPSGVVERMAPSHRATRATPYVKMQLIRPDLLPDVGPDVQVLDAGDSDACTALLEETSGSPEFFRHDLLGTGRHTGIYDGATLVAMAGTHVIDTDEGIAAIGNVNTLPAYRGRGLARQVVAALARRLRDEVDIVALNVGRDNTPARNLYEGLGFLPLMEYEEAELVRR
jgi:predicted GNAT family acetyltransferase